MWLREMLPKRDISSSPSPVALRTLVGKSAALWSLVAQTPNRSRDSPASRLALEDGKIHDIADRFLGQQTRFAVNAVDWKPIIDKPGLAQGLRRSREGHFIRRQRLKHLDP